MHKTVLLAMMRLGSQRLPGKNLMDLGGKPMAQWSLEAMKAAGRAEDAEVILAVPAVDKPLIALAEKLGIGVIRRDEESANGETIPAIYNDSLMKGLMRWQLAIVAGGCMPFVEAATYRKAIKIARQSGMEGCSAFFTRGFVWDEERNRIIGDDCLNTKTSPGYYTPAHVFSTINVRLTRKGASQYGRNPIEIEKTIQNIIHVDTPEDFRLAEAYWRGTYGQG